MDDTLLQYYERELTFIREMGAEFAKKYPKIAGRLQLEADKCEDPHTERLIEAVALLCGRIHRKIDDDFPEITESLFHIIYPHYISPIPSMTVVRFDPVRQTIPPTGYRVEKGSQLYSKPVGGTACQFSSAYPAVIWPLEVTGAGLRDPKRLREGSQQALWIQLKTFNSLSLSQLGFESLRFYLNGSHQHMFLLYELLFNNVTAIEAETTGNDGKTRIIPLPNNAIRPVGLDPDEVMIPASPRSFPGYLTLFEYFCFPEKFLFFDLTGLDRVRDLARGDTLDIWIYLDRPAKQGLVVNAETFCLNAAPAVNLFKKIAEPIRVERQLTEYRVIPDMRRQDATEVYYIERVVSTLPSAPGKTFEIKPFYSLRHHLEEDEERTSFWHMNRRLSGRKGDNGTEVYLCFADLDFHPADPGVEILTVHTVCTNRDMPARLPFGDPSGDFSLETAGPVSKISCLVKPTPVRRSGLRGALQWRLVSHLSLNYLSLVQGGEGALQEILRLYDFEDTPSTAQQIEGIVKVSPEHVTRRIGRSFCRGIHVGITFDEDKFVGAGLFLFASVLERFLAQYVSVNSFTQLEVKTLQRKEVLKKWPPRNGNRILI
ncbi:MAG: type VI secretion system baseplate subunit TssF [Desulfobacterota bacterium]|jgi:type VI secretion system protein ImpG|nr:type VI secretion system baseplate subunit TssF [Thermodesulfobacteriota bacterium]